MRLERADRLVHIRLADGAPFQGHRHRHRRLRAGEARARGERTSEQARQDTERATQLPDCCGMMTSEVRHGDPRRAPRYHATAAAVVAFTARRRCYTSGMLKGSRDAVLKRIQPISVHGQISLDVQYIYADEDGEQIRVARVGPEAVEKGLDPGDRITLEFVMGVVTQVRRAART